MKMMMYDEWITKNVPYKCHGECKKYTDLMKKEFPELTQVRGHIIYYNNFEDKDKRIPHWWMTTNSGEIVDPTASQFGHLFDPRYDAWEEGKEEPTGVCMNCGEYVYKSRSFCSDECERANHEFYRIKWGEFRHGNEYQDR